MAGVFGFLFDQSGYSPHGYCLSWQPDVLYTHIVSDILIGGSYLSVAMTLLVFTLRRRDLEFPWLFISFTVVFGFCGLTHLSDVATMWLPVYGLQGTFKAFTGICSLLTAALVWRLLPKALSLPSPSEMRAVNERLSDEVEEHRRTLVVMEQAREIAERASAAKSAFLASMSHELRTPLNAVLGFSETLALRLFGELNAKQAEYVEHIRASGAHLLRLINDVLDYSKVESGRIDLTLSEVDLDDVAMRAVDMVGGIVAGKKLTMETRVAPDAATIEGDEVRLTQVIVNLLSNATKFTPPGGHIGLTVDAAGTDFVRIRVIDDGIGMAREDIPQAMEMFSQVDQSLSRRYEGTGIGLPLSRAMVEAHNGTLTLDSELGRGTTVTITLPRRQPAA